VVPGFQQVAYRLCWSCPPLLPQLPGVSQGLWSGRLQADLTSCESKWQSLLLLWRTINSLLSSVALSLLTEPYPAKLRG